MGNMITVTLLTDCWSDFKKDPDRLFRAIEAGFHGEGRYPYGRDTMSGVQVQPYHHASESELVMSRHNLAVNMSRWSNETRTLAQRPAMRDDLRGLISDARSKLDGLEHLLDDLDQAED